MAHLDLFNYQNRQTWLHQIDPRFKCLGISGLSMAVMNTNLSGLFLYTLVVGYTFKHVGISFVDLFKSIASFLWLMLFVIIAHTLTSPENTVFQMGNITVSLTGITMGIILAWQMLSILFLGILFITTTKVFEIKNALEWFLKPLPSNTAQKASMMLSLLVRFIPVILHQSHEIHEAQLARGIQFRTNPIYRMRKISIPLLRKIFLSADEVALAMEARNFTLDRTQQKLSASNKDWFFLMIIVFFFLLIYYLNLGFGQK